MKFNVIIVTKKTLIIFSTLLLLIGSGFLYLAKINFNSYYTDESIPIMAKPQGEQAIKKDLNGDGKEDVLYITAKEEKYYVEALINKKTYFFNEKKTLKTLGNYYSHWPMTINIIDINRDRIPEIIIQSSQENTPIQHIFTWNNNEFLDIYCSTNNILGILDSSNNKTPKLLSASLESSQSNIQQYLMKEKNLKNISYEKNSLPGLNSVIQFIDLIEYPYELSETPNIFAPNINSDELAILWQLDKENFTYTFQDCFFRDDSWDSSNTLSSCTWTLNFKKALKNSDKDFSQISFKICLNKINNEFFISLIDNFNK
ncbi:FG-GAP repeat domain-containing protein [Clostridium tarantellae]|uniref:VCBS repeat-containing protein n=1 Tax=Clostridium tarantellae TaxID=39493 RepID=A0A6I1MMI4_9CLOT|nr:VCBS repeat-containing protein [Clostridium tarantellae]MPQ43973.1 hypothetical protein [Clostridium tarantellae]